MIDASIVTVYLGVMLLVGWRSRRQSPESYWVAERRYSTGAITMSLVATIFGASSTIGVIGLGYSRGLTAAWWSLIGAVALIPFGLFLAARVRKLAVYTLPDILRNAWGDRVAVPAAVVIAVAWCGVIAAQMIAGARLLGGVLGLEYTWALSLVAAVFVLYTYWGGQLSVIRTDRWQLPLFVGGLLVLLMLLLVSSYGAGVVPLDSIPAEQLRFPVSADFGWYDLLVFYPLIVGLPYMVGPDVYSRVLCARGTSVARRAAFFSAAAIVPVSFLLVALGILIRVKFPGIVPEAALPTAVSELVPVGLAGLIVAGFLAAIMSSADTTLISASTILTLNVFSARGGMSREQQLKLTRLTLLAVGLAAWVIAAYKQDIIGALLLGYAVFVGGVVFPTLASFARDRLAIRSNAAMAAVVVGGGTAMLGAVRNGEVLRALLGSAGDTVLQQVLGPGYPAILPVLLSVVVLIAGSGWRGGSVEVDSGRGFGEPRESEAGEQRTSSDPRLPESPTP